MVPQYPTPLDLPLYTYSLFFLVVVMSKLTGHYTAHPKASFLMRAHFWTYMGVYKVFLLLFFPVFETIYHIHKEIEIIL